MALQNAAKSLTDGKAVGLHEKARALQKRAREVSERAGVRMRAAEREQMRRSGRYSV